MTKLLALFIYSVLSIFINFTERNVIDFGFIDLAEGGLMLQGYVPLDRKGAPIGQSGTTIANGIDLGQMNKTDLVRLIQVEDLATDALYNKLVPYTGLKRWEAVRFLEEYPLTITEVEARHLALNMQDKVLRDLRRQWDHALPHKEFNKLPNEIQTVLFSLFWNFGTDLPNDLPQTWQIFLDSATIDRWDTVYLWLKDFPSKNPQLRGRRAKEAEYLKPLTNIG